MVIVSEINMKGLKAYIANNLSLFLGQKHLWGVNKRGVF